MAVNSSNSITAEVYNGLQSRISKILGVGENTFGYGQPVSSSPVEQITDLTLLDGDSILAQQLNNLRSDFNTVNEHQQGEPTDINSFSQGDIVGADQSGTDIDHQLDGSKTFLNGDATKGINDFFALIDTLESNRFNIAVNQQEINVLSSSVRTNSWNGLIDTIFLVEFASANDRRYFFNAGGEIRFQGTVTNVSTQRGSFWNDLIENWQIEAREQTSSSISFRITLVNDGPESDSDAGRPGSIAGGIQESVAADIEFELSTLSAANAVTVSSPSASVTNSF